MFEHLKALPADPILGLNQTFLDDPNSSKINLSVGVYQNAEGLTPIFKAVKQAEQELIDRQTSKSYVPQSGDPAFVELGARLLLGDQLFDKLESAGLTLKSYTYYSAETNGVDFTGMMESLRSIPEGDVVLLHGCCHNPTGTDLSHDQWEQIIALLGERSLLPFIDIAYQGFGSGLEEDAYGLRLAVEKLPEVLIASSCSKNFGLYRERTGAVMVVTQAPAQTAAAKSHILSAARRSYSMSPFHGGGIVGYLLGNETLSAQWRTELDQVRTRMNTLRKGLAEGLNEAQSKIDFSFVGDSKGMFCFLGIAREDVLTLRSEFGIYLLESTRFNVAGLSEQNLPIIIERVADVITR